MSLPSLFFLSKPTSFLKGCIQSVNSGIRCNISLDFALSKSKMDNNLADVLIKQLAPPLTNTKHKGQAGRVGVFGGSLEYTGMKKFICLSTRSRFGYPCLTWEIYSFSFVNTSLPLILIDLLSD